MVHDKWYDGMKLGASCGKYNCVCCMNERREKAVGSGWGGGLADDGKKKDIKSWRCG